MLLLICSITICALVLSPKIQTKVILLQLIAGISWTLYFYNWTGINNMYLELIILAIITAVALMEFFFYEPPIIILIDPRDI